MSSYKNALAYLFICAGFALASINCFAQTQTFDFGPDGKPVQTGGPGFGQDQSKQVDSEKETPDQPKADKKGKGAGKEAEKQEDSSSSTLYAFLKIFGAVVVAAVIIVLAVVAFRRRNREEEDDEAPDADRRHTSSPRADAPRPAAPPRQSPAAAAARAAEATPAPAAPSAPAPAPAPAPASASPSGGGSPSASSATHIGLAIAAALFASQVVRAADYTLFPSAVPVSGSVNAIVTGPNVANLTGCSVALPDTGCAPLHLISPTQRMVRLTAGPNALGGQNHPREGNLRLSFNGSSPVDVVLSVATGTSEQIGVAMLSQHVTPSAPPAPAPVDQTVRRNINAVRTEVRNTQAATQSLAERLDAATRRIEQLEQRPQTVVASGNNLNLQPVVDGIVAIQADQRKQAETLNDHTVRINDLTGQVREVATAQNDQGHHMTALEKEQANTRWLAVSTAQGAIPKMSTKGGADNPACRALKALLVLDPKAKVEGRSPCPDEKK